MSEYYEYFVRVSCHGRYHFCFRLQFASSVAYFMQLLYAEENFLESSKVSLLGWILYAITLRGRKLLWNRRKLASLVGYFMHLLYAEENILAASKVSFLGWLGWLLYATPKVLFLHLLTLYYLRLSCYAFSLRVLCQINIQLPNFIFGVIPYSFVHPFCACLPCLVQDGLQLSLYIYSGRRLISPRLLSPIGY